MNRELFRKCFPNDAVVRELSKEEILDRHLPVRYWCEHMIDFPVWSPKTGRFHLPGHSTKEGEAHDGFLSDGASVPDLAYAIISDTHPDVLYPAYGHDFLFACSGVFINDDGKMIQLGLEDCNWCIDYWMQVVGAAKFRRYAVNAGLFLGSWACWKKPVPIAKSVSTQQ